MNTEELIEEIEIFEKLDVKYLLEELEKKSTLDFNQTTQKPLELTNELSELIVESLIVLIKNDEKFALDVELAMIEVNKRNKVADITVAGVILGAGISLFICLLKGKNHYGVQHNEGKVIIDFHIDNVSQEEFKDIIKECMDNTNES